MMINTLRYDHVHTTVVNAPLPHALFCWGSKDCGGINERLQRFAANNGVHVRGHGHAKGHHLIMALLDSLLNIINQICTLLQRLARYKISVQDEQGGYASLI